MDDENEDLFSFESRFLCGVFVPTSVVFENADNSIHYRDVPDGLLYTHVLEKVLPQAFGVQKARKIRSILSSVP